VKAVLKSIATLRRDLSDSKTNNPPSSDLVVRLYKLLRKLEDVIGDPGTLDELLSLASALEAYKGRGNQSANREMSQWLCYQVSQTVTAFPESANRFDCFDAARSAHPTLSDILNGMEKIAVKAFEKVRGPRSRSRHASDLKALEWETLSEISSVVRDPAHLRHAVTIAEDTRVPSPERAAAVEFLTQCQGEKIDAEIPELLFKLQKEAPDRTFLVGIMQAQIDLGLSSEFGALDAVGDWDDQEEQ